MRPWKMWFALTMVNIVGALIWLTIDNLLIAGIETVVAVVCMTFLVASGDGPPT